MVLGWMFGTRDLDAKTRISAGAPDMGCYEAPALGSVFMAR